MYPVINLFGLKIYSYGLMILLASAIGMLLSSLSAKKKGISADTEFLFLLNSAIGAMIGAKLLYILPRIIEVWDYRDAIFNSSKSFIAFIGAGFVFYGGLLGGIGTAIIYCRYYKEPLVTMIEVAVPYIPLAHGIGRIGCFLAGCCYGIPSERFGIVFDHSIAAPNGVALFPVQLLEAGINFLLCGVLVLYARKERKPLSILGLYMTVYSVERFLLEFLRYDQLRGVYFGLSTSQWLSLVLLPIGLYLLITKRFEGNKSEKGLKRTKPVIKAIFIALTLKSNKIIII